MTFLQRFWGEILDANLFVLFPAIMIWAFTFSVLLGFGGHFLGSGNAVVGLPLAIGGLVVAVGPFLLPMHR